MKPFCITLVLAFAAVAVSAQSVDECLQKDSISCVQKSLFRQARGFFNQETFELVGGVSLVKSQGDRASRSDKSIVYEQEIEKAASVAERQSALENFVGEGLNDFLYGRNLKINFSPALEKINESARALGESIPVEVRQAADEVAEGRGKKKLKKILPLLLLAKAKIGALATLAYFALALIAKKAIIASLISIAISAFVGLRSLWEKKGSATISAGFPSTGYNAGWSSSVSGGYPSAGSAAWDDGHAYAQSQAFSGYH
ncbi:uncharacterized protein LOC106642569 [Copidosoma floridanum]|uniref:uncharacterized protein LOC106642569 n=1 Tax=Copidosoma floridanum TaxID=29053 RepID=UPI0006C99B49|nr:uncharacterized protein LOC106642569 [Copidosoma floridanum]